MDVPIEVMMMKVDIGAYLEKEQLPLTFEFIKDNEIDMARLEKFYVEAKALMKQNFPLDDLIEACKFIYSFITLRNFTRELKNKWGNGLMWIKFSLIYPNPEVYSSNCLFVLINRGVAEYKDYTCYTKLPLTDCMEMRSYIQVFILW